MLGFITDKQAKQLGYTHEVELCGIKCFYKLRRLNEKSMTKIRAKNPLLAPALYALIVLRASFAMLCLAFGKEDFRWYLDVVRPL